MDSIWIAAALFIAVFNISKAKGADGKPIEPQDDYDEGIVQ
jgi:hypothetical protein